MNKKWRVYFWVTLDELRSFVVSSEYKPRKSSNFIIYISSENGSLIYIDFEPYEIDEIIEEDE
jgi:hypothetical protein